VKKGNKKKKKIGAQQLRRHGKGEHDREKNEKRVFAVRWGNLQSLEVKGENGSKKAPANLWGSRGRPKIHRDRGGGEKNFLPFEEGKKKRPKNSGGPKNERSPDQTKPK